MEEEAQSGSDNLVTEFNTYEDFLSSQITSLDLLYLEVRFGPVSHFPFICKELSSFC